MNTPTTLPRLPRTRSLIPTLLALALAAVFIAPSVAKAKCMAGNFTAWPPPDTPLTTRPMLLLEGFGNEQLPIAGLADGGSAQLVAKGHTVDLVVESIHQGDFGLTQAVVRPASALKPATRYTLELHTADGQPARTTMWHQGEPTPVRWTTAAADHKPAAPAWSGTAVVTGQSFRRLGCGPSSHIEVKLPAAGEAPLAVQVELQQLGGEGESKTYVLPVDGETLRLGHGMCSGAFRLTGADDRYRAELTLLDAAGNAVGETQTIEFGGVDPSRMFRKLPFQKSQFR